MPRPRFAPVAVLFAALLLPLVPGTAGATPSAQGLQHRRVDACADRGGNSVRCFAIDRQAVRDDGSVQPATATTGLTPAQVKHAYGFSTDASDGSGQTVAVVVAYDAPTIEADLATFSTQYGLPACTTANGCFSKVNLAADPPNTNAGWALETSLDVEWVHAMAPGAHILLVEANSASLGDLVAAVDYAKANANYVSNSWGASETSAQTSLDSHFVQTGVSFFVASGDSGSQSWPSTSPNVVSVGGTSLSLNPDGTVATETAWSGSGGGCSRYDTAAAAQAPVSQGLCGTKRATPDVSLIADPNVGVAVYDSTPYSGGSGWQQVGGTSAATPMWAARAAVSGALVDAQDVYGGSRHYRDVVSGSNRVGTAGLGYDLVTGRGSWIDPPAAPIGLTASVGDSAAALSWAAPAQGTVTSYTVYRSSEGAAATAVGTSTSTSYTDTQLQDGAAYTYTVTASNATAEGPASDATVATPGVSSGATISGTITDNASPENPLTGACATAVDGNGVDVRTAKSDEQGAYAIAGLPAAGYTVRFAGCDAGRYMSATYTDGVTNQTIVTVTDGADATGIDSALVPTPPAVPGAPTGVTAVAGDGQATVSWAAPGDDGGAVISGYVVTPYAGTVLQTPVTVPAAPTSATVTGLTDGTSYTFTVAAINSVGTGTESALSAAVTPQAAMTGGGGTPPPPSGGGGSAPPSGGGGGGGSTPPAQATTVSSSSLPVTSTNPVVVSVTDPAGGAVTFAPASSVPPPAGLDGIGGAGFVISATPAVDAAHPLVLTLQADPSLLADGRPVVAVRDGAPVTAACTGSAATPDPCISSYAVSSTGVVTVTILSTHASTWSLGTPTKGSIALACAGAQGGPFTDVPTTEVHRVAIDCLHASGIANGVSATAYNPGGLVTRGAMAAFIARLLTAAGVSLGSGTTGPFADVPVGSTFAQAINQLASVGVVNGVTATSYQPTSVVTRGQMAAFLVRAYDLASKHALPSASAPFTDVGAGSTFSAEIGNVWETGITQGVTPTAYEPSAPVLRDQMASFLARTLNLLSAQGLIP